MCGNRSNVSSDVNFSDKEELMDSTDDGPVAMIEYKLQTDGNSGGEIQELEEIVSNLSQQLQEPHSLAYNDMLTDATIKCQDQIVRLEKEIKDLKDENSQLKGEREENDRSMRSLQAKVNELQVQVEKLQAQVAELKRKVTEYERDRDKVYLCQVAVEFEQAICSHVLPEVFSKSNNAKIDDLLKMLNSGDEEYVPLDPAKYDIRAILSEARQRWDKVCEDLKLPPAWKKRTGEQKIIFYHRSVPDIFRAMSLLRHKRNFVAHPNPVSVQVAEETVKTASIRQDLEEWEFRLVKDFILSLRANIEKSGIQTNQKRLKLNN